MQDSHGTSLLRSFYYALSFLTIIPVKLNVVKPTELGGSLPFFPLVGLVLGVILALAAAGLSWFLAPLLVAVALVTIHTVVTGGLHLDGLADVFDGLGGWHGDKQRMLTIMQDSRVGAHGVMALILVLLAKTFALIGILILPGGGYSVLLLFPITARWLVVPLIALFPYARPEGLGQTFNAQGGRREVLIATGSTLLVLVFGGWAAMFAALVALVCTALFGWYIFRKLGGLTGDVYGAAIELAEVAFLVTVAA